MKTLNENWFAFTLIAVIFGILGFLLGRTSGPAAMGLHPFIKGKGHVITETDSWITSDGDELEILKSMNIDVIHNEEGKVILSVDSLDEGHSAEGQVRVIKIIKD
ncbi:hypothetical protein N9N66_02545 [Schleiferiaceae bacterium]|nr:hypothetical protein [Schleiferiaceae bacterium]MDA8819453.1 hypothetical protein [Schleiferiaceae bacterium]